jgi:hypothetical protein
MRFILTRTRVILRNVNEGPTCNLGPSAVLKRAIRSVFNLDRAWRLVSSWSWRPIAVLTLQMSWQGVSSLNEVGTNCLPKRKPRARAHSLDVVVLEALIDLWLFLFRGAAGLE